MNLRRDYSMDEVLGLDSQEISELITSGSVITKHNFFNDKSLSEEYYIERLVYDNSISNYFFEFEPETDINRFIEHAFVVQLFPKTGKISFKEGYNKSLFILLPEKAELLADAIKQFKKQSFKDEQDFFNDEFNEDALSLLQKSGSFKGQITCCSCGEPGCSSEYLWMEKNIGLISFSIVAVGLSSISIFPFQLVE
jgi:hypothetical protein